MLTSSTSARASQINPSPRQDVAADGRRAVAEELLEERVKKLEKSLESLAEVPKQLTRLGERVERIEAAYRTN